jgi:cysteine-S-conjugate beta-lyase
MNPTSLIHHSYQPPSGFSSIQPGIYKASTVIFSNVAALRARKWQDKTGYTYGLHGTPSTFTLEKRISTLEGGNQTLLVPSGLAAIALINLALLNQGDQVLIPDNAYGPNKEMCIHELSRFGIEARFYDSLQLDTLQDLITDRTRVIWLEAAGSVTMEFPDLPALVRLAHDNNIMTALDNTWGAGIAFCPFDLEPGVNGDRLGVDVSMQALTKFPSGGGDVLLGSVTTKDPALHLKLQRTHMHLGWGVGANDVELVLRSLPSMMIRYQAHDTSARHLAYWLAQREEVEVVLHPAVPSGKGHEHWRALCTQAAGLFSIVLKPHYSRQQVDAFVDALKLFKIGFSWGGPMSLVVPYELQTMRQKPAWQGALIRFSIGLEDAHDLLKDLEQAFDCLAV